jgi:hypothetical protein
MMQPKSPQRSNAQVRMSNLGVTSNRLLATGNRQKGPTHHEQYSIPFESSSRIS